MGEERPSASGYSEVGYRSFFMHSQLGLFRTQLSDGLVLDGNEAFARMCGVADRAALLAAPFYLTERYEHLSVRERFVTLLQRYGKVEGFEGRFRRLDASLVWVRISARLNPEMGWIEGVAEDVTERRLFEEHLDRQTLFHRLVADVSYDFIGSHAENIDEKIDSMLERTGRLMGVDRAYVFLADLERGTITNTHEWCAPGISAEKEAVQDLPLTELPWWWGQLSKEQVVQVRSLDDVPADGVRERELFVRQHIQSLLSVPLSMRGRVSGILGFDAVKTQMDWKGSDVYLLSVLSNSLADTLLKIEVERALRRARDQAQEASRTKSEFLANMSHEIRTPLTAILGFSELLEATPLSATQRRYLNNVHTSGHALLGVVNDILDFSKIEAGRLELEEQAFDLRAVVEETLAMLSLQAQQKGLLLEADLPVQLPALVLGDALRLKQVLLNLLSNALKFTHEGSVRLRVATGEPGGGQVGLHFRVEDTGIGIREEERVRLFRAFSQADTSTTRKYGGTGLGLIISNRIVERMGGHIDFVSRPGEGTVFYFSVVLKVPDESVPEVHKRPAQHLQKKHFGRPFIVVAEDQDLNVELLRLMLRGPIPEVRVKVVGNGRDLLSLLEKEQPALALVDVQMPVMGGMEAVRLWRTAEVGSGHHLPMVALSAGTLEEEQAACLQAGMDDFLAKPVDRKRLQEVLDRFIPGFEEVDEAMSFHQGKPVHLDLNDLLERLGGNQEGMEKVLHSASFQMQTFIQRLRELVREDKEEDLRVLAHAVKGLAWNVGMQELGDLAQRLELAAGGPAEGLTALLTQVEAEWLEIRYILDAWE